MTIVCLAGGVGAAKFLDGLCSIRDQQDIHIIVNTGDDSLFYGLYICPDIDIVMYTLAGIVNQKKGWGIKHDSFTTLHAMERFLGPQWFNLGDNDMATSIFRTHLLQEGLSLTEITQKIAENLHIQAHIYPMCNEKVPTILETDEGILEFEEYFVHRHCEPRIIRIIHQNIEKATLQPSVERLLQTCEKIIICPSNPFVSINPILAIPSMRQILQQQKQKVYAISPIVGGQALKGPLKKMLDQFNIPPTCESIARIYHDIMEHFVIDVCDAQYQAQIEQLGIHVHVFPTIMKSKKRKKELAQFLLSI